MKSQTAKKKLNVWYDKGRWCGPDAAKLKFLPQETHILKLNQPNDPPEKVIIPPPDSR